jgi:preprotein translocase subunit SecA
MDYLREGIHLRGFAQIDPLVAYKNEAFTLFQDLMNSIWADFARMVYNVEVQVEGENGGGEAPLPDPALATGVGTLEYSGGSLEGQPSAYGEAYEPEGLEERGEEPVVVEQRKLDATEQLGRNDPCWCGSGKKFKKCHGA